MKNFGVYIIKGEREVKERLIKRQEDSQDDDIHRAKRDKGFMKEGLIFNMKYYRNIRTERKKRIW